MKEREKMPVIHCNGEGGPVPSGGTGLRGSVLEESPTGRPEPGAFLGNPTGELSHRRLGPSPPERRKALVPGGEMSEE